MTKHSPPHQTPSDQPTPKARSKWLRKLSTVVVATCVGLLLIEGGFRLLGPPQYEARKILPRGVPFTSGPNGLLQYQPNASFYAQYDPRGTEGGNDGRVDYQINSHGFRGPDFGAKAETTFRVVCLGDSFTFGEGVAADDTWPRQLESLLKTRDGEREQASVEVINAGVQGHGLIDAVYNYAVHEREFEADVVLLAFFMNDLMPQGETIALNDALHRERPATGLAKWSRVADFFQDRAFAKQQHEVLLTAIHDSFNDDGRNTFKKVLTEFDSYLREQNIKFAVVVYPLLWQLDDEYPLTVEHRFIRDTLAEVGIAHLDLFDALKDGPASSLWAHPTDHHPNAAAHRRAARAISNKLESLGWLP